MPKYLILLLLFFKVSIQMLQAQYVSEIIEYQPAPGQLINTNSFGSPQAAESLIGGVNGLVSLGAFGGYIIVKMDESIENHPDNPFGIDFTIMGNALADWSEAASVEVMKDENNNGLADDQWYLLAGSDYYLNQSQRIYSITYYHPNENTAADVLWIDSNQDSGYVFKNSFHQQSYYPLYNLFPEINQEQYTLNGLKIEGHIDLSNASQLKSYERYFGFADNRKRGSQPYDIPDNPYTTELENSGGDAMDISWARDENGNQVELDKIHFIKISTAMNASTRGLGEISTEIAGIIDVTANPTIQGELDLLALSNTPKTLILHASLPVEAIHFISGIPAETQEILWSSSNSNIASINSNGLIETHQTGWVMFTAKVQNQENIFSSFEIFISEPSSIEITLATNNIHAHTPVEINAIIEDQDGEEIGGLETEWNTKNPETLQVFKENNQFFMMGLEEGTTYLYANVKGFPLVIDSIQINVLAESNSRKVYITVQTEDDHIIARQSIWVDHFDLNPYVQDKSQDYGIGNVDHISLAHGIAALFEKIDLGVDVKFKDDEASDGALYLWKVPQEDNSSLNFIYGYGGNNSDESNSRVWLIKHNDHTFTRDLHQIEIHDEDEILVYHVQDSREEWTVKQLVLSKDTAKRNERIKISYQEEKCQFFSPGIIELLEGYPIPNASLYLNGENLMEEGNPLLTNSNGEAEFSISQQGQYQLSIGDQLAEITISNATRIEELNKPNIHVYPNPFEGSIHIESPENLAIDHLYIYNSQGQLVKKLRGVSQHDLSDLESGIYLLQIMYPSGSFSKTILKR